MSRIFICGQTSICGTLENMKGLVNLFKYFDGAVFAVNYKPEDISDGVEDLIKEEIKNTGVIGEVIRTRWVNLHHIAPSLIMQSGHFQQGDWILFIDSPELLKEDFAKNIKQTVKHWDSEGITISGWNRVYFFKWNEDVVFQGTPHQYPVNLQYGKYLNFADESKVVYAPEGVHFGDFILNRRLLNNSTIIHPFKYTFEYVISNQLQMIYPDQKELEQHEADRKAFRRYFQNQFHLYPNVNNMRFVLTNAKPSSFEDLFINYFDYEPIFRDYYRLKILNTPLNEILKNRNQWSFRKYVKTGNGEL